MTANEMPVDCKRARFILGGSEDCRKCRGMKGDLDCEECKGLGRVPTPWSESYMTAVKKAMGIKGRKVFVSDVRKFIRDNPNFTSKQVQVTGDTYKGLLAEVVEPLQRFAAGGSNQGVSELLERIERKLAS